MFQQRDLDGFVALLDQAHAVVSMREIAAGNDRADVIGMRHDVDDNPDSFDTARKIAGWEAVHGYRSTFFMLHTASYWDDGPFFRAELERMALLGHEIGIHTNAIAQALHTGDDPDEILWAALDTLRDWGHQVIGVAGHGDRMCADVMFVNDEQFTECARPVYGDPDRTLQYLSVQLALRPRPMSDFGLRYCAPWLPRGDYLSDSGGQWNQPIDLTATEFAYSGQLHVLQHSDWWSRPFSLNPEVLR